MKTVLSDVAINAISKAVDSLYDRAKARFLGPRSYPRMKQLVFGFDPDLSVQGIYEKAAAMEGSSPDFRSLNALTKIAGSYLDASREKAKAKLVHNIQTFIERAEQAGEEVDVNTVLGGQLADVWGDVTSDVKRIFETETTIARNTSIANSIAKIGVATGNPDPTVIFIPVKDKDLCSECERLHLLDDKVTPRCWKMSDVQGGYHKKGEDTPKVAGLHPHCRCVMSFVLNGYGFAPDGRVTYISPDHDAYEFQKSSV